MLTNIRFEGYRLLDDFEADLGQLTIVIGANATGKSTLLDALSLLTYSVDWPIEDVLAYRSGMYSVANLFREPSGIAWRVTLEKSPKHPTWSGLPIRGERALVYEGRIACNQTGKISPDYECLRTSEPYVGHDQPFKLFEVRGGKALVYDYKSKRLMPFGPQAAAPALESSAAGSNAETLPPLPDQKVSLFLSQMRFPDEYLIPTWVRAYFSSFVYYPGFDVRTGSSVRTAMSEIRPQTTLNQNGDNLGTVLHEIFTRSAYRDAAQEIRSTLMTAYPHVEDISAETAYGAEPRILVRVKERGCTRSTELWELSDGMIRLLLLCAALMNPVPPAFIAIDEPETGLHPRLLAIVADLIRASAERSQVLVTTHNPTLLNLFSIDEIAVLTRAERHASWWRPGNRETLRRMLASELGVSLGELHVSGELEAMP